MLRSRNIILPEAARWRGRTVALYGGSFNPAHKGHRRVARECLKRLGVDAVWFLVSPGNPLKDAGHMADFEKRFASISALVSGHPRMMVTDIEARLGTRYSADTITELQKQMPHTRFIWVMGADNLATFDKWRDWRKIAHALPIAVFDRPGYSIAGQNAKFARVFGRFRTTVEQLGKSASPAWAFLTIPRHPASATKLRQQLGETWLTSEQ
ncbi:MULTISPECIES: nicotinate-nucleotide adenylyltransferase [Kordiimonas]|uniref:nicotinate-nucleotide adenylyltransferase n=1 Tax=Kordiimonas TaxID=288021 RepID=UPI00257AD9DE|nr:nicotinate-nucleotide adenylyltransferase [Kordiimonas sp. UBA4487]